eukprot:Rmarinus@m.27506
MPSITGIVVAGKVQEKVVLSRYYTPLETTPDMADAKLLRMMLKDWKKASQKSVVLAAGSEIGLFLSREEVGVVVLGLRTETHTPMLSHLCESILDLIQIFCGDYMEASLTDKKQFSRLCVGLDELVLMGDLQNMDATQALNMVRMKPTILDVK